MNIRDENRALFELLDRYFASKVDMIWPRGQMLMQPFSLTNAETGQQFKVEGDFLYIDKTSTGTIYVQFGPGGQKFPMGPNMFFKGIAYRDLLISWDAQAGKTVQLWYGWGGEIIPPNQDITAIGSITNPVDVRVDRFEVTPGVHYQSTTALVANTPQNVLAAAANTGGVVVHGVGARCTTAAGSTLSFLAKAAAPASVIDGSVIAVDMADASAGGKPPMFLASQREILLASGLRLDFIASAGTTLQIFNAMYTLR